MDTSTEHVNYYIIMYVLDLYGEYLITLTQLT